MLRLGGVASRTYLVAFPAIKQHFQQQGLELDWVLYSSWDALVEAFVHREVDLAWNGPLAYLKIKRRLDDPCQVVAMRDIDVNLVTDFITQPQSAIHTVQDLKGKRFAFGARGSVEAGLLAYHFLKQGGIEPSQDLTLATFCEERPTPNADSQCDVVDRRKRNKKVAVHPCPEHLCVQDATRGEGALGATRGHQEVQAEPGVARCGGAMDVHEPRRRGWCLCTPLLVLPPCRGETESPNAHPIPCQAAPP